MRTLQNKNHSSRILSLGLGLLLATSSLIGCASDDDDSNTTAVHKLEPDLETQLALSSAPAHVRADAGVYLHDATAGLVEATQSKNGYNCFVARTDIQAMSLGNVEYREDILIPICFDAVGSEHILPMWLHAEAERAKGTPAAEMFAGLDSLANAAPRAGVAPMLSPFMRTFVGPGQVGNMNYPHYMYYAPGITNEDISAIPFGPVHTWVDNAAGFGGKQAYFIQPMGVVEKAAINAEHAELLQKLCASREDGAFCLDMDTINAGIRQQLEASMAALGQ